MTRVPLSDANIASHLVAMAQRQPDAPAILTQQGTDSAGRLRYQPCSFQQLNAQSDTLAQGLQQLGITHGTRTALCIKPSVDFFALTFALFKIGAVPVLIDPGIGLKNFGRCLAQAQPTAFIGIPLAHLLRRTLGWAKASITTNITTGHFGGISLQQVAKLGSAATPSQVHPPTCSDADTAAILFTSGSTGPAKGVLYTHANFSAQVRTLRDTYHIQPGEMDLATFPLFGLFGPALGMTCVIPIMDFTRPGFVNPRQIIEPIQQLNLTNMFGSPALIHHVGQWGREHQIKLPSLKRVISAGAPVPAEVMACFREMLSPGVQIFTPYGATESLPVCSIGSDEILNQTATLTDQGHGVCIGRPVGDMQVRIIKITDEPIPTWSDELELPPRTVGEIFVQGPVVTKDYYRNPEATQRAKIYFPSADSRSNISWGGHRMGDVGYFDEQGRLWFCGRKSQRVRLAEGDIFSTPFEAVFNTHPKVYRSALVGVTRNQIVLPVICIELHSTVSRREQNAIEQELRTLANRYPHTRIIQHFLFHPRFPVDIRHNAKIGRELLTQWAERKLP